MKEKFIRLVFNFKFIFLIYILLAVFAGTQAYFLGPKTFGDGIYTYYNNFVIFKQSFFHLVQHKDLYLLYPGEHWDYFKYSPSFAFLFAPLALMPSYLGLICWNLINAIGLFLVILYLPKVPDKSKKFILLFIVIELMTSLQNSQSNGLIAALIIGSFLMLEKENYFVATLFLTLSVFIKLFGIVAFVLLLFYPKKFKSIGYSLFWVIIIGFLPVLVISFHQLEFLYTNWGNLLKADHLASYGLSVLGWLKTWFGVDPPKIYVMIAGVILFCIPLFRFKLYSDFNYRVLLLGSVLIWIVIFNHKAESPTFIIAISGCALWYFPQARTAENLILILMAFVFTTLSPTDIFPREVRIGFFQKYDIKAVPCIFIWFKVIYDMMTAKSIDKTSKVSKTIEV